MKPHAGPGIGATLETVRALALALPGMEEGTSYGTPAFKAGGKLVARLHQDGESLVVFVDPDARELLLRSDPQTFFVTDHYVGHPLLLVRLARVSRALLAVLLEDAWEMRAPERLVASRPPRRDASPAAAQPKAKAAAGGSKEPAAGGSKVPAAASGSKAPAAGRSKALAAGRSRALAAGGSKAPAAGRSKAPAASGSKAPAAGRSKAPAAGRSKAPAAGRSKAPAAGRSKAPVASPLEAFGRIRTLCLALPGAAEVVKHGRPCFAVRGKTFVMFMDNHHGDSRLAIWCKAPPGAQAMVVESDPRRFFVPPYVGPSGWIGARLDLDPDWDAVAACVEEAYRMFPSGRAASRKPTRR